MDLGRDGNRRKQVGDGWMEEKQGDTTEIGNSWKLIRKT